MALLIEPADTRDLSGVPVLILSAERSCVASYPPREKLVCAAAAGGASNAMTCRRLMGWTQADVTKAQAFYAREAAPSFRSGACEAALNGLGDECDDLAQTVEA